MPERELPPIDSSPPAEKGSAGPEPVDDGGDGPDDGGDGPADGVFKGTAKGALDFLRANLGLGEKPEGSNRNFITETVLRGGGAAVGAHRRRASPGAGRRCRWP